MKQNTKSIFFLSYSGNCPVYNYRFHQNKHPSYQNCRDFTLGCPTKMFHSKNVYLCKYEPLAPSRIIICLSYYDLYAILFFFLQPGRISFFYMRQLV